MINMIIQGGETLYATSWAGKTGISEHQFEADLDWARRVEVDLEQARQYGQAVYAATDDYLAGLNEEDLNQVVDMTSQGYGEWKLDAFLLSFVLSHIRDIMGEVSALKGVQGLKGYPF